MPRGSSGRRGAPQRKGQGEIDRSTKPRLPGGFWETTKSQPWDSRSEGGVGGTKHKVRKPEVTGEYFVPVEHDVGISKASLKKRVASG